MLNEKKICIIIYAQDEQYEVESLYYINQLVIPEGYQLDVFSIKEIDSISSGYQEVMNASDAKYKIYLHQNVFLINSRLLIEALEIFKNKEIGMIGVLGQKRLTDYGKKTGYCYISDEERVQLFCQDKEKPYIEVETIENFFIMTQYDIAWDSDLEESEDFYAMLHSIKMQKEGYRAVIPNQGEAWCLYDGKKSDEKDYYQAEKLIGKLQR